MRSKYDLIIVGAGPAGLTAGIFAKRQGLHVMIFDNPEQPSNLAVSHVVENYPGFEKIIGAELLEKMRRQVENLDVEIKYEKVISLSKDGLFVVCTTNEKYKAKTLILATGLKHRKANIPGEEKFFGRGVSYCATCDGPLFRGKNIAVIGGGDSAVKAVIALKDLRVKKIYLIHRREQLRADAYSGEKLRKTNVEIIWNSIVEEIAGKNFVESITIKNVKNNKSEKIKVDGVFVEVGSIPAAELAKGIGVKFDKEGFIITNDKKETNIQGVFAAGDISTNQWKQDVTAVADGAVAALSAYRYIK
ncbi:MAG: thioredoxin-disulfide reductase [Candidatus Aenigmatarchaeota archaeon]